MQKIHSVVGQYKASWKNLLEKCSYIGLQFKKEFKFLALADFERPDLNVIGISNLIETLNMVAGKQANSSIRYIGLQKASIAYASTNHYSIIFVLEREFTLEENLENLQTLVSLVFSFYVHLSKKDDGTTGYNLIKAINYILDFLEPKTQQKHKKDDFEKENTVPSDSLQKLLKEEFYSFQKVSKENNFETWGSFLTDVLNQLPDIYSVALCKLSKKGFAIFAQEGSIEVKVHLKIIDVYLDKINDFSELFKKEKHITFQLDKENVVFYKLDSRTILYVVAENVAYVLENKFLFTRLGDAFKLMLPDK